MLRILLTALFGYWAYRVWKEFDDSSSDDFDVDGAPAPVSVPPSSRNRIAGTIP